MTNLSLTRQPLRSHPSSPRNGPNRPGRMIELQVATSAKSSSWCASHARGSCDLVALGHFADQQAAISCEKQQETMKSSVTSLSCHRIELLERSPAFAGGHAVHAVFSNPARPRLQAGTGLQQCGSAAFRRWVAPSQSTGLRAARAAPFLPEPVPKSSPRRYRRLLDIQA